MTGTVRLDRLVGRRVRAGNNRVIGRLEEVRVEHDGHDWVVTGYLIGPGGLWERLGIGARLLFVDRLTLGYLARWDQLDVSSPEEPRLLCQMEELQRL